MRHNRDLPRAGPSEPGVARLFELCRQGAIQNGAVRTPAEPETLRADVALRLRTMAVQSLRPRSSDAPR
ncbi:hypothetical protein ACG74X_06350 [Marivita sp. S0852]|uniref:hypothetical protein n=1 Tax=Marivita sp. S0852 TaxID=3373893 RepID=UPI003981F84C